MTWYLIAYFIRKPQNTTAFRNICWNGNALLNQKWWIFCESIVYQHFIHSKCWKRARARCLWSVFYRGCYIRIVVFRKLILGLSVRLVRVVECFVIIYLSNASKYLLYSYLTRCNFQFNLVKLFIIRHSVYRPLTHLLWSWQHVINDLHAVYVTA